MKNLKITKKKDSERVKIIFSETNYINGLKEVNSENSNHVFKETELVFIYKDYISFVRLFLNNLKDMRDKGNISEDIYDFILKSATEYKNQVNTVGKDKVKKNWSIQQL